MLRGTAQQGGECKQPGSRPGGPDHLEGSTEGDGRERRQPSAQQGGLQRKIHPGCPGQAVRPCRSARECRMCQDHPCITTAGWRTMVRATPGCRSVTARTGGSRTREPRLGFRPGVLTSVAGHGSSTTKKVWGKVVCGKQPPGSGGSRNLPIKSWANAHKWLGTYMIYLNQQ